MPMPSDPAAVPASATAIAKVRLYCGLLGDCFLLEFPTADGAPPHRMLIDFGVLLGMASGAARLPAIAEDIHCKTGGGLDAVVLTHRHWDHLCGFGKHPEFVDDGKIGQLWMSWIEDPDNAAAKSIRGVLDKGEETLAKLGMAVQASPAATRSDAALDNILDFAGRSQAALTATRGKSTVQMLEDLRDRVPPAQQRYHKPGDVIPLPGTGVRVFVLGPPTDEHRLRQQNPSADKHEVYKLSDALDDLRALPVLTVAAAEVDSLSSPFAHSAGEPLPSDAAQADDWLKRTYFAPGADWRQIGDAWLGSASDLAMQFDSIINNTSLVLAFELAPKGAVMVFAADAQVGNWLSWSEATWDAAIVAEMGGDVVKSLLERTTFYKVGHHGSINATARAAGLEQMTSGDLTVFIPVDEAFARQSKRWDMPHASLLDRLTQASGGRVLRGDRRPDGLPANSRVIVTASPDDTAAPFYIDLELS